MANTNITNPFTAPGTGLVSPDLTYKLNAAPNTSTTYTPLAPATYATTFTTAQAAATLAGLTALEQKVSSGSIVVFNSNQLASLANANSLWAALVANSSTSTTFSRQELADMIIVYDALYDPINGNQAVANSGILLTGADLTANANLQLQQVLGYFPNGCQTVICSDQYMICAGDGTGNLYVSNTANAISWDPLNYNTMEAFSDTCLAVDQFSGQVVAFGIQSIEYFTDQGLSPGSPYAVTQGTAQNYGLAARFARAAFMNGIAFLGQNQTGQAHVFLMTGYTPQIISTPDIDQIINSLEVINDAVAHAFDINGHSFFQITFPTARRTLLYDGTTQLWSERQSGVQEYDRHLSTLGVTFNSQVLEADYASGNVYIVDPTALTDNGFLIRREFAAKTIEIEGNEFSIPEIWLDMDVGNGQQVGVTNPKIMMYVSKDEGKTWGRPRVISMGTVGQYLRRVKWNRLGSARHFNIKWIMTDPVPFIITRSLAVLIPGTEEGQ